ncbi:MAG: uracil-xanthine permease family protein [Candidatus Spyradocola sp.]|nr:uracil-xanthine permease family protein [Candidatus Spyradocola sp.]
MTTQVAKKDSFGKLLLLGVQHVFAMFGATVLVPLLTGMDPAVALLCAGVGTWIFHLCTGRKVPTYLGSSFAFIAAIQGAAAMCAGLDANTEGLTQLPAYQAALPYATGGILVAGALYLVLALLVKLVGAERVRAFFPPIVTGPIVTIIGLMLAPSAIANITTQIGSINVGLNWLVAAISIATIFIVSLFAKGIFKLVPILIGIVVGYIAAICCGMVNFTTIAEASWISLPHFFLPKFDLRAIGLIAPIAIVTFVEHIGDVNASSAVCGKDFIKDPGMHRTLMGDGLATMFAGLVGGPANTTYSENTGVLAATKNYNPVTLEIAACIAIVLAFFGKFSALITAMPGPVLGGVSVVLYGMIAAVGLRTLVENKVDFTKSRNLLIAAVMLVLGLGANGAIVIGGVSISGVALAAVLGILLNKVLPESIEKD